MDDFHFSGNPAIFEEDPWLSVPASQRVWLFQETKNGKVPDERPKDLNMLI